jgi:UDP-glucose-4-epimerase GalE
VLLTGGAGYIGAHIAHALVDSGASVAVVDDLSTGVRAAVPREAEFAQIDIRDAVALDRFVARGDFDACIHLAGVKNVGESMRAPGKYLEINVAGTVSLLTALHNAGVPEIVFSSSCSLYGDPPTLPVTETSPLAPLSAYGTTKLAAEDAIRAMTVAGALRAVSLRYFNAAGAAPDGRIGEALQHSQNLVPLACAAALGLRGPLEVFGDDFPTPDGTAQRDYIHVCDLADAHVAALDYLARGGESCALNVGTGRPSSVLEVIAALERGSGREVPYRVVGRRPGDPAAVWAEPARAEQVLGWRAQRGLDEIVTSAWRWHSSGDATG